MSCLENTRHEHFCQLVAKGASHRNAYRETYGKDAGYLGTGGSKLMQIARIRARVAELQAEGARETSVTLEAAQRFLHSVVMAKPAEVDENSPICQSIRRTQTSIECKLPDKLRALELAMKLQGFLREPAGQKTGDSAGDRPEFVLSKSMLLAIQQKRQEAIASQKYNSVDNSPAHPSNPAP